MGELKLGPPPLNRTVSVCWFPHFQWWQLVVNFKWFWWSPWPYPMSAMAPTQFRWLSESTLPLESFVGLLCLYLHIDLWVINISVLWFKCHNFGLFQLGPGKFGRHPLLNCIEVWWFSSSSPLPPQKGFVVFCKVGAFQDCQRETSCRTWGVKGDFFFWRGWDLYWVEFSFSQQGWMG